MYFKMKFIRILKFPFKTLRDGSFFLFERSTRIFRQKWSSENIYMGILVKKSVSHVLFFQR